MPVFRENQELLKRFRQGDREALATVYKHYVDDVYQLIRYGFVLGNNPASRVPGIQDPQSQLDAIQEVFVRAFNQSARLSYDGLRPYRAFLLRIAKNFRIDQVRKQGRDFFLLDETSIDTLSDAHIYSQTDENAEQALHFQRLSQVTSNYIRSLDPELQRFIQLRFVEELSQYEVAEKLAITRRRVRTLEKRVGTGLRKYLNQHGLI